MVNFKNKKNTRLRGSRNIVNTRSCIGESKFLHEGPKRTLHKAVKVKLQLKLRTHNIGNARMARHLPRRASAM